MASDEFQSELSEVRAVFPTRLPEDGRVPAVRGGTVPIWYNPLSRDTRHEWRASPKLDSKSRPPPGRGRGEGLSPAGEVRAQAWRGPRLDGTCRLAVEARKASAGQSRTKADAAARVHRSTVTQDRMQLELEVRKCRPEFAARANTSFLASDDLRPSPARPSVCASAPHLRPPGTSPDRSRARAGRVRSSLALRTSDQRGEVLEPDVGERGEQRDLGSKLVDQGIPFLTPGRNTASWLRMPWSFPASAPNTPGSRLTGFGNSASSMSPSPFSLECQIT